MQKQTYLSQAKPFALTGTSPDGLPITITLEPKSFSTGSVGYHFAGKVQVNGVKHQVGCLVTAVNSKEWEA